MSVTSSCRRYLEGRRVRVQEEWLEACIQWLTEENQGNLVQGPQLNNLVYEQWLMADLREMAEPSLPENLHQIKGSHKLTGTFVLQLNYICNIGSSAYSQFQKIKGQEIDDVTEGPEETNGGKNTQKPGSTHQPKWKEKSSRMLYMELTDGTQNIEAIEYEAIPSLSVDLTPGCKVEMIGPLECRDGILLLKSNNIRLLGGNAEQLMEDCTQLKILRQILSLPEEEEKTNIDALANRDSDEQGNSMGILHSDTVNTRNLQTTVATRAETSSTGGQRTIGTNSRTQPVAKREEIKTEHSNTVAVPVARVQRSDVDRSAFELEDRKTTDVKRQRIQTGEVCDLSNVRPNIGQINRQPTSEISRQNKNNTITVPNQRNQETPPAELEDLFGEDDDFDIVDEVENLGVKQEKPVTIVDPVKEEVIDSFNDVSLSHEDYFDLNDIELGSNMAKGEGQNYHFAYLSLRSTASSSNSNPHVYLTDVVDLDKWHLQRFTVKAYILTLLNKLQTFPSYRLEVCLDDGSATAKAVICDAVIRELIGFPAKEIEEIRSKPRQRQIIMKKAVLECQKQMATKVWWMQIERDEMGDFVVMEMREWNSSSRTGREALRQMESRLKKSS